MDRAGPPRRADLEQWLGGALEAFERLRSIRPGATSEWRRFSKDGPWTLKVVLAKRTLWYLTPTDEGLHVSMVFGVKATDAVLAVDDLPEFVKTALGEARPYAEGRGIRLPVGGDRRCRPARAAPRDQARAAGLTGSGRGGRWCPTRLRVFRQPRTRLVLCDPLARGDPC